MNHLTLRGTHREMGFQWGARLAERGLRLLEGLVDHALQRRRDGALFLSFSDDRLTATPHN